MENERTHATLPRLERRARRGPVKALLMMSIRTKIFFGCISLTLVTVVVGLLLQNAQTALGNTALGIYDNGFIPMSYMRSAQAIVLGVSRDLAVGDKSDAVFIEQLQSVLDALEVAGERAMSPRGEAAARALTASVSSLQAGFQAGDAPSRAQFMAVEQQFDAAVQIYAADGFRLRRSVEAIVQATAVRTYLAMAASVVTALVITLLLSRAIVPSIRHAVRIATSIASGRLDNQIERRRPSETGVLLDALATMQASIAEKIAFIETLMARQASSHAAEIALQHTRFEAALDNLTLGLCMFDAEGHLLVHNRRFVEMFAGDADDGDIAGLTRRLAASGPDTAGRQAGSHSHVQSLDDGRIIAVSEQAMPGGGRVVTYEDITERHLAEARLSHMARHDALTGLPNRVLFREQLESSVSEVGEGSLLAVLCLDLDRFKTVNDTLGHPVGDALLREAAVRLREAIPPGDTVVRLGGDEFAVIHHADPPGPDTPVLAERLIEVLAVPFQIGEHRIAIGVSIGIAECGGGLESPDSLLKNADLALYQAKAAGRGTFRFFERHMDARMQARRLLELDLRTAIAEERFELFYQPLINIQAGGVVSFEALLRWHHPTRGLVSPADFIPLAEETGLIIELGRWVIDTACRDAAAWPEDVNIAINLSPLQFRGPSLVADVAAALDRSGLPGHRLDLEITESLMLLDSDETLASLHALRARGIRISMDDFGTGYSSLSYLRRFEFDKIKIDQSFIRNMDAGSDGHAIVEAFIALGQSLRMKVVAEGVETEAQLELLRRAGCEEVQGYLFSRPQPVAAVEPLIHRFSTGKPAGMTASAPPPDMQPAGSVS